MALEPVLLLAPKTAHPRVPARLLPLGFRAIRCADITQATSALAAAERPIRAALVDAEYVTARGGLALGVLRGGRPLGLVALGPEPDEAGRSALRAAGLDLALFEPFDDNELRWALNEVSWDPERSLSHDLRVPVHVHARLVGPTGEKAATACDLSVAGAFLETPRPSPVGGSLGVVLALPEAQLRIDARVVSTNTVGNLRRPQLPLGMGVQFVGVAPAARAALAALVEARARRFFLGAGPPSRRSRGRR